MQVRIPADKLRFLSVVVVIALVLFWFNFASKIKKAVMGLDLWSSGMRVEK